jgi:branched-chain amino acid transport system ATP-binding protein
MDAGKIIADGEPQAVLADKGVIAAYLGGAPA